MHKRVDRVEAVCAAALVERGQKGTGNAGERAVGKRERQRGVKDEPAFFAAYARDAAAAIRELGGEKSVAKRFEKLFAKALGIVDRSGENSGTLNATHNPPEALSIYSQFPPRLPHTEYAP